MCQWSVCITMALRKKVRLIGGIDSLLIQLVLLVFCLDLWTVKKMRISLDLSYNALCNK